MSKTSRKLILCLLLIASVFFTYKFVVEVQTANALRNELKEDTAKEAELKEQKAELEQQKINLNDVDYILRYARGKYLVTKDDGEQVFTLPEDTSDDSSE